MRHCTICAAAWRIIRYRDLSFRPLWLSASPDYSIREIQAEWRRLHIDSNILWMTNSGMMLLIQFVRPRCRNTNSPFEL